MRENILICEETLTASARPAESPVWWLWMSSFSFWWHLAPRTSETGRISGRRMVNPECHTFQVQFLYLFLYSAENFNKTKTLCVQCKLYKGGFIGRPCWTRNGDHIECENINILIWLIRVFKKLFTIQECQFYQFRSSCAIKKELNQWNLQLWKVIPLHPLISNLIFTSIKYCQ